MGFRILPSSTVTPLGYKGSMRGGCSAATRILIADDHDVVRSGLHAILSGQPGWEVVAEAEDGRQAVALAAETQPDVAIIDYQLPLMNGVDATREIKASNPAPRYSSSPCTRASS